MNIPVNHYVHTILIALLLSLGACMDRGHENGFIPTEEDRKLAKERVDLSQLADVLNRIELFHVRHRTGLKLHPPPGQAGLDEKLSGFPCRIPDELRALWSWRNGEKTDKFVWYHRFLPAYGREP